MAGSCAVCLVAFTHGEKFVVMGTEVVHQQCIGGTTMATKHTHAIIEFKRRIATLDQELQLARVDVRVATGKQIPLEQEIADLKRQLRAHLTIEAGYRQERDSARRARDAADNRLVDMTRERDAARREASMHQLLAATPPPPPQATTEPVVNDERDPAEVRFSLLEIDRS